MTWGDDYERIAGARHRTKRSTLLRSYMQTTQPRSQRPDFTADDVGRWFEEAFGRVLVAATVVVVVVLIVGPRL